MRPQARRSSPLDAALVGDTSRGLTGFFVIALHCGLIAAFAVSRPESPENRDLPLVAVQVLPTVEPVSGPAAPPRPERLSLALDVTAPALEVDAAPIATPSPGPDESPPESITARPSPSAAGSLASAPKVISDVEYIRPPAPRYPPESRAAREEGLVVLRVLVDREGRARETQIVTSSGHARLDEAARAAVVRAVFKPYVEDGDAQPSIVTVPIEFTLRGQRSAVARR